MRANPPWCHARVVRRHPNPRQRDSATSSCAGPRNVRPRPNRVRHDDQNCKDDSPCALGRRRQNWCALTAQCADCMCSRRRAAVAAALLVARSRRSLVSLARVARRGRRGVWSTKSCLVSVLCVLLAADAGQGPEAITPRRRQIGKVPLARRRLPLLMKSVRPHQCCDDATGQPESQRCAMGGIASTQPRAGGPDPRRGSASTCERCLCVPGPCVHGAGGITSLSAATASGSDVGSMAA